MFDWSDLRYFIAVGRAGSFNAAARTLSTTQPTVGRRIAALEKKVGTPVFNRLPDGIALTETGLALWEKALAVEAAALSFENQIGSNLNSQSRIVKISATEGLGSMWLTPRLAPVTRANPTISLQLLLDNRAVDLLRREADIAIRLSRPLGADLICRKIGQLAFGLFASRDYLEREGRPQDLSELRAHQLVTLSLRQSMLDEVWQDLQDSDPRVTFSTNSSLAEVAAVRAGFGIGLIPIYVGEAFGLEPILGSYTWRHRDIWLVAHPDLRKTTKVRFVFDEILKIFQIYGHELSKN